MTAHQILTSFLATILAVAIGVLVVFWLGHRRLGIPKARLFMVAMAVGLLGLLILLFGDTSQFGWPRRR
jgi:hypothetical protein